MYKFPLFLLIVLFTFPSILSAQDCNCTIAEVQNNTVIPCDLVIGETVTVSTAEELRLAIIQANNVGGNMTILIEDGTYQIASTAWYPYITANDLVIRSVSGNRDNVILTGNGMMSVSPGTENGLYATGNNITIADLTIKEVGNHGIAVDGDNLFVHNVKIQNTFEQMLKGTSGGDGGSDNSIVQCSLFEYPSGEGPQFYIGGLDIHMGDGWIVRDNIFKNIQSPSGSLAEHAIHFWNHCSDNTIERNWIINCDRGIGFGLGSSPNEGGVIKNNMIYNDGTGVFNDVGIGLETSPGTKVFNNTIFLTDYPNAIEYRFEATQNVDIANNLTNKAITSRNGGQATLITNMEDAVEDWFVNVGEGDLHLADLNPAIVDQGTILEEVVLDFDQTARPQGTALDIGAHEWLQPQNADFPGGNILNVQVFPNPAAEKMTIEITSEIPVRISILDILGRPVWTNNLHSFDNDVEVDVSDWPNGLYFCEIVDSDFSLLEVRTMIIGH
ncbi:MAG: T9SS C-terminal target domain-containing protein [Bacteroidetes bacterium]|nr:MAG: T9SS C-terminal target domain-containing protein [Bacteroidota bacterium]